MKNVEVTRHGDFFVATAEGDDGFTAWAKMGMIQTDCPVKEPGTHVWFNFGRTREEAKRRILDELGLDMRDRLNDAPRT
jgi:hypothetical protein